MTRGNIRCEAEQMRTLVEQMLTLARADNGVRPAAMEPVNFSDVKSAFINVNTLEDLQQMQEPS